MMPEVFSWDGRNRMLLLSVLVILVCIFQNATIGQTFPTVRGPSTLPNRLVLVDDLPASSNLAVTEKTPCDWECDVCNSVHSAIEQACYSGDQIVASIEANPDVHSPRYSIVQLTEVLFHTLRSTGSPQSQRKAIMTALQIAAGQQVESETKHDVNEISNQMMKIGALERQLRQVATQRDELLIANEQLSFANRRQQEKIRTYQNLENLLKAVKQLEASNEESQQVAQLPTSLKIKQVKNPGSTEHRRNEIAGKTYDNPMRSPRPTSKVVASPGEPATDLKMRLIELRSELKTIQERIDRLPQKSNPPVGRQSNPLRPLYVPDGNRLVPLKNESREIRAKDAQVER